jgi:hypothetical protein
MSMDNTSEPKVVLPSPRILKVIGILNIVFGSALILFGLCMGLYLAALPVFGKAMTEIQKQAEAKAEASRKADLEAVDAEEKAAQTEEEKRALQEKRQMIEARKVAVPITSMDFGKMGFSEPKVIGFYAADLLTAIVLDVLMIVAGVGLLQRRLWGLKLGLWTAGLKIVRLVVAQSVFALVIAPPLAEKMGRAVGTMIVDQQKAAGGQAAAFDPALLVRTYLITFTMTAAATLVFGAIYPAISLWLLTRPGARAACDEMAPPGLELNETW